LSARRHQHVGADIAALKKKISSRLLTLPCVSGLGIAEGKLRVYLARHASKEELDRIRKIIATEAAGAEVQFETSGSFRQQ